MKPFKRKPMLQASKEIEKEVVEKKEPKKREANKLPSDEYIDEIEPIDLEIDENRKFIISVKRGGEFGLPMCDIRQYQTTELYTGFTKKGINFPIELLPDLIELLQVAYQDCEERELID